MRLYGNRDAGDINAARSIPCEVRLNEHVKRSEAGSEPPRWLESQDLVHGCAWRECYAEATKRVNQSNHVVSTSLDDDVDVYRAMRKTAHCSCGSTHDDEFDATRHESRGEEHEPFGACRCAVTAESVCEFEPGIHDGIVPLLAPPFS